MPTDCYPEGSKVTMNIGFGSSDLYNVDIGTKAESSQEDESRIHDLYVMLFDSQGTKFYGRYFTYEHMIESLATLDAQSNEGWYVSNASDSRGVVKISTESKVGCTLVVIANISNTVCALNSMDAVDCLSRIETMAQLRNVQVTLEQEIINRTNLFLMIGTKEGVNTGTLSWGTLPDNYNPDSRLQLSVIDAKIKFYIKFDDTNFDLSKCTPRHWKVFNVPDKCYLFDTGSTPSGVNYFNTEEAYFEGTETYNDDTWYVFSFYILENRQEAKVSIEDPGPPSYYLREKQEKNPVAGDPTHVQNGDWVYAPDNGTYVQFDMVLGLTPTGIQNIVGSLDANHALTSEARYTVHMGDFTSSSGVSHDYDNYDVERNHKYSYYITIENSSKIYVEVVNDREDEPGQEGSLLLVANEIINCDPHYAYHTLTFNYDPTMTEDHVAWYVKTPFSEGSGIWNPDVHDWEYTDEDYQWVKFCVNEISAGAYLDIFPPYPGDSTYDPDWTPSEGPHPDLMDVHQLLLYVFDEINKKNHGESNDFRNEEIRVTAFINEYYYEVNPITGELDPDLWRTFVNAKPREMHILSSADYSRDYQSDLISATYSIIQQSIQTFYNIYSPDLTSIWGLEHVDEMSYKSRLATDPEQAIWSWWPTGRSLPTSASPTDDENGRYNTAAILGISNSPRWDTFVSNSILNNLPYLNDDYQYMAYSCLNRNRDNNGNGVIDPDEVRWYTAAANQLIGIWVGKESLSPSVRIYQPVNANNNTDGTIWRAWVVSSTSPTINQPYIVRAEEAATKSLYGSYEWAFPGAGGASKQDQISSVRCVRNVGTYQADGRTTDVSYAPLEMMVDQYYEIPAGTDANQKALPNVDGTYTIRFSRLNPKSIREYTAEDFPEHEEYSFHNNLYLELNMQDPTNTVYDDNNFPELVDQEMINDDITSDGYNKYCPEGYRLPSMTELLIMSSLLPSSYWTSNIEYPSRTFFSRGKRGSNITSSESNKIGWRYSSKEKIFHMNHANIWVKGIRCVRDLNRTGDITGKIIVPNANELRQGENMTIQLNFSSMGSAIRNLSLSLVYISTSGMENVIEIPTSSISLSGVSLRETLEWTIPAALPLLGSMSIRATVRNSAGISKIFETPIRVLSPVFTSVRLLNCEYDENLENPPFPILVTASSPSADIESWKLSITDPNGDISVVNLPIVGPDHKYLSYIYDYHYSLATLQDGTYTFQLETKIVDGPITRSEESSMDILQVNYWPNPGVTGVDYLVAADIANLWHRQKVENMDFYRGDFIEANMDISHCTYLEVMQEANPSQRDNDRTIGRDNLISVGYSDTDYANVRLTVPYVFHVYYPAHDGGQSSGEDYLRFNPARAAGDLSNGVNYKSVQGPGFVLQRGNAYKPKMSAKQHFRLDQNGVFWNNQKADFSEWANANDIADAIASYEKILTANTVYVGSTQGWHHSRAGYMFVRAVHNGGGGNIVSAGSHFENNPNNGGSQ